jgi:heme A synthase
MLRKTIIIAALLPATYFWLVMLIFGDVSQPFFASLVVGGLLGIIGLIRVAWSLDSQISRGKLITQLFLSAGILSALSGIIFLVSEIAKTRGNPLLGYIAIVALLAVTIVGAFELYRISRNTSDDNAT